MTSAGARRSIRIALVARLPVGRATDARFSGVPLAIGLVLLIPQFYLPGWARIAHGVLVAIGLVWLAADC